MSEYRVNLDIYNGPLDLLLYLIRREEVDIYDIPIARITEQYVHHVKLIEGLDANLAGEFLVMAATLMEIKTRMLLPSPPTEEGGEEGLAIDPRAELVRQLLEYKNFKDAAGDLRDTAELQAMKFPSRPGKMSDELKEASFDLEDVQVWDLLEAFDNLMIAIGQQVTHHEVIYDDTPIELHAVDIVDRLNREGSMRFAELFAGRTSRSEMVGLFLALLELVKQKRVLASQSDNFDDIHVHLNPDPPDPDEEPFIDDGDDEPIAQADGADENMPLFDQVDDQPAGQPDDPADVSETDDPHDAPAVADAADSPAPADAPASVANQEPADDDSTEADGPRD